MSDGMLELQYVEDVTTRRIMEDDKPQVKFLRSAVGTGKSVACLFGCAEFCLRVVPPNPDGSPGRARVLVVRQDQTKLKATTLATFRAWFGEVTDDLTSMLYPIVIRDVPFVGEVDGEDRTVLIEWVFMGVGSEEEVSKLKSFEATCAFINEVQYYDGSWIVTEVYQRLGRYPMAQRDERGDVAEVSYKGERLILCDYNPPDDLHWLYELEMKGKCPPDWKFYPYPPPLLKVLDAEGKIIDFLPNPEADYAKKHPSGYDYWLKDARTLNALPGKQGTLKVNIFGEYGSSVEGKPVYPAWADEYHLTKTKVVTSAHRRLYIGLDHSGVHPAAVFVQVGAGMFSVTEEIYHGTYVLEEWIHDFLIPRIAAIGISRREVELILDPADGRDRTGFTAKAMLMKLGFKCVYAPTQDPKRRRDEVAKLLIKRMLQVDILGCPQLVSGFRGQYAFEKLRGTDAYKAEPDAMKSETSHVHDALQYVIGYLIYGAKSEKPTTGQPAVHRSHGLV